MLPTRLGHGFRSLVASSWSSNLGDGIAFAGSVLFVVAIWAQLRHIVHDDEAPVPAS